MTEEEIEYFTRDYTGPFKEGVEDGLRCETLEEDWGCPYSRPRDIAEWKEGFIVGYKIKVAKEGRE